MTMLAKQVWRIHTKPNSLEAKTLNAKYYPKSYILKDKLGTRPSYLLRSIHHNCWIIKQGTCWNIGNGNKIFEKMIGFLPSVSLNF